MASGFPHITRLGGVDRYETALKIAEALDVKTGTPIVLAYGENYLDALSISSAAATVSFYKWVFRFLLRWGETEK